MTITSLTDTQLELRKTDRANFEKVYVVAKVAMAESDEIGRSLKTDKSVENKAKHAKLFDHHIKTMEAATELRDIFVSKWGADGWEATSEPKVVIVSKKVGLSSEKVDALFASLLATTDAGIEANKDVYLPENLNIVVSLRDAIATRDRDGVEAVAYQALALDTFWGNRMATDIVQGVIYQLFCYDGQDYRYYKLWIEVAYAGFMMLMQAALVRGEVNPRSLYFRLATKTIEFSNLKLDRAIVSANRLAKKEEITPDFVIPTGHENRTFTDEQTPGRIARNPQPFSEFV